MKNSSLIPAATFVLCVVTVAFARDVRVQWTGRGTHRILVRIEPRALPGRKFDYAPARLEIHTSVAPGSIQVVRYDPATGKPIAGKIPFRFDDAPPVDFFLHYWPGDGQKGGTLVWRHEQVGDRPSYYAIYFNSVKEGTAVSVAPRGWIGDGDAEYLARGPLPSALLVRPVVFDWNGDGLPDLIVGDELGYVTLYRNIGTKDSPKFGIGVPLLADGKPIKVPNLAAPLVVDWNGDGRPDLLLGQDPKGLISYYENVGTRTSPKLTFRGYLQADGKPISPPFTPVPEEPPGVFKDNYGSIPAVVDWDGNGRRSLLVGTYITGEMYLYRNVGTNPDGTPELHYVGPVKADGKNLDVGWNATPSVADLRGDGRWELVSGSMVVSARTGGDRPELATLHFYERTGDGFHELPFPFADGGAEFSRLKEEESHILFPTANHGGAPYSTALGDLNSDGLIDLLVGTNEGSILWFKNIGSKSVPKFQFAGTLTGAWVPDLWGFDSMVDFYGDGRLEALQGGNGIKTMLAFGPSYRDSIELRTASGKAIGKAATHGDEFGSAQYYDFDRDGKPDLLFGAVDGSVWLYRNVGTRHHPAFADGVEMRLTDGSPLIAGLAPNTKVTDFTVLQGNRAIPAAADFNGDGKTDLIVGTAIGKIYYFENMTNNRHPRFAPGKVLLTRPGRIYLTTADFYHNGLPDVIFSCSGESGQEVFLMRHVADKDRAAFLPPQALPTQTEIPYPVPAVVDWYHDGDNDVLLSSSYGVVYLLDGSFIRHGYEKPEVLATQARSGASAKEQR